MEGEVPLGRRKRKLIDEKEEEDDLETLIQEIIRNSRSDRKSLENALKHIQHHYEITEEPMMIVEMSDKISKLIDSLTRNNSQLVELSKVKSKRMSKENDQSDDDVFDEIGDGFDDRVENN